MKLKKVCSALMLAVFLSVVVMPVVYAGYMGDADLDYMLSAADARRVLRTSVNLGDKLCSEASYSADVDRNGKITSADARKILRASVGLEKIYERFYKSYEIEDSLREYRSEEYYRYDGQLISKKYINRKVPSKSFSAEYIYDDFGFLTQMKYANGVIRNFKLSVQNSGYVAGSNDSINGSYYVFYDKNGRLTEIDDYSTGVSSRYDSHGRVMSRCFFYGKDYRNSDIYRVVENTYYCDELIPRTSVVRYLNKGQTVKTVKTKFFFDIDKKIGYTESYTDGKKDFYQSGYTTNMNPVTLLQYNPDGSPRNAFKNVHTYDEYGNLINEKTYEVSDVTLKRNTSYGYKKY